VSDPSGLFNFTSVPDAYRQYLQPSVFDPWARALLDFVRPALGEVVLDVAAGTGAVSHAASPLVGSTGRVIASDLSPLMLAATGLAASGDRAAVDTLESSADHLNLDDGSIDVGYCQQGLQFMPDRARVMRELHRVLRPGGRAGIAVWAAGRPPEPFDTYARVLQAHEVPEPYPNAYDTTAVTMSEGELEDVFTAAGFRQVSVRTVELPLAWPDADAGAFGLMGSSYGPAVAALPAAKQQSIFAAIVQEGTAGATAVMAAVFGRGSVAEA
jgi:ubiquinone/menaquinone biosynthesis C-methylase UbiE